MANLRLKKQMIEVVDNQIKANDPPCTKKAFLQLLQQGCSKQEAREMIAAVVLEEIYDVLKEGKTFDKKKYELKLKELLEDNFIFDNVEQALADDKDEILQAKHKVYDALYKHKPSEAVRQFMLVWDKIKQWIVDEFYFMDAKGKTIKPEMIDIDDKTEFRYELYNWLQDMEMEFSNSRMFEERIQFCNDVIELFAWQEDSPDNYRTAIGETLNYMQKYRECDEWFEVWLKEELDNPHCINSYLYCLTYRDDIEKAKMITEKYITEDIPCTLENEMIFIRAQEIYEELKDHEMMLKYQAKIDQCQGEYHKSVNKYASEDDELFYFHESIVKEKKVYPNEPCPCGSGKKYKKRCKKVKKKLGKAYQLKIIIENSEPLVWRRVVVPNYINFGQLHEIIQTIFGWEDDHLHDFYFPSIKVRIPGSAPFGDDSDYENIRIVELVERVKWFRYTYDFGDNWIHKIMVEKKLEDYDYAYPQVRKFKGENFEEDSGGVLFNWKDELDDSTGQSGKEPYTIEDVNAKLRRGFCLKGERKAIIKNMDKIGQDDFERLEIMMEPEVKIKKIYPNDLCPCGSGKKYKKCCGRKREQ